VNVMHLSQRSIILDSIHEKLGSADAPDVALDLLVQISNLLDQESPKESLKRKTNFLMYEARSHISNEKNTLEKMEALAGFFFSQKNFNSCQEETPENLLLNSFLSNRMGSSLVLCVLIRAIASELEVPCGIISLRRNYILKFCFEEKNYFLITFRNGQVVRCSQLLEFLNPIYENEQTPAMDCLESLNGYQIIHHFLENLKSSTDKGSNENMRVQIFCLILLLEPSNIKILGERGLLYDKIGAKKAALADLKRYFSFVEPDASNEELLETYLRLQNENTPALEVLT